MDELTRRNVRYICFRLRSEEVEGKVAEGDGIMDYVAEIRQHMESQSLFGGWENFGVTWDVDEKAHFVVVSLKKSHESVWNAMVEETAKELPLPDDLPQTKKKKSLWPLS